MVDMKAYLDVKVRFARPSEQKFIEAARSDRVFWRGDEIEFFKAVYEETFRMRAMGPIAYRAESISRLKGLITNVVAQER